MDPNRKVLQLILDSAWYISLYSGVISTINYKRQILVVAYALVDMVISSSEDIGDSQCLRL